MISKSSNKTIYKTHFIFFVISFIEKYKSRLQNNLAKEKFDVNTSSFYTFKRSLLLNQLELSTGEKCQSFDFLKFQGNQKFKIFTDIIFFDRGLCSNNLMFDGGFLGCLLGVRLILRVSILF